LLFQASYIFHARGCFEYKFVLNLQRERERERESESEWIGLSQWRKGFISFPYWKETVFVLFFFLCLKLWWKRFPSEKRKNIKLEFQFLFFFTFAHFGNFLLYFCSVFRAEMKASEKQCWKRYDDVLLMSSTLKKLEDCTYCAAWQRSWISKKQKNKDDSEICKSFYVADLFGKEKNRFFLKQISVDSRKRVSLGVTLQCRQPNYRPSKYRHYINL
jgi:hypothetical protein